MGKTIEDYDVKLSDEASEGSRVEVLTEEVKKMQIAKATGALGVRECFNKPEEPTENNN